MSSAYNARPVAAEVMVDGSDWSVIRDRDSTPTCGVPNTCHIGSNERPGRRPRSPAAPACRPPRTGAPRHPVRAHLAGAVARSRRRGPVRLRRSARPAASAAALAAYRAARRHGIADRSDCWSAACSGIAAPDDKAADRRLELASGLSAPAAVGADRPAVAHRQRARYRVGRALAGACRPRGKLGAPAAHRPAASRPGAARPACTARRAGGRPGRRLRDRRRRCALAAGAGDGTDLAARDAAAGDRVAGLDHTARLHAAGADLPQAGQRDVCRCPPARASRSASPVAAPPRSCRSTGGRNRSALWTRQASRPTAS